MGILDTFGSSGITSAVVDVIYPIGMILEFGIPTNPAQILGIGVWEPHGQGKVTVCVDPSDPDFNSLKTGGAKTVALTQAQIAAHTHTGPSHSHSITHTHTTSLNHGHTWATAQTDAAGRTGLPESVVQASSGGVTCQLYAVYQEHRHGLPNLNNYTGSATTNSQSTSTSGSSGTGATGSTGNNEAHNNLQPYQTVFRWIRTS